MGLDYTIDRTKKEKKEYEGRSRNPATRVSILT